MFYQIANYLEMAVKSSYANIHHTDDEETILTNLKGGVTTNSIKSQEYLELIYLSNLIDLSKPHLDIEFRDN